jgi:hypothetical protein
VDQNPAPPLFDPDLDLPRLPTPAVSQQDVSRAQRVVVNPMLAILGGVVGFVLIQFALRRGAQGLFWLSLLVFIISIHAIQFHCLDCGTTGWIGAARDHACPDVLRRCLDRRRAGLRLGVRAQIRLWAWFLGLVALCYLVLSQAGR